MWESNIQYYGLELLQSIHFPETLYIPSEAVTHCLQFSTLKTKLQDWCSQQCCCRLQFSGMLHHVS